MGTEAGAVLGFAIGVAGTLLATPLAIHIAERTDFYDRPREYRKHSAPTPFLGGAAVFAAFLIAATVVGAVTTRYLVVLVCAATMWGVGTLDDRVAVSPQARVFTETVAAMALYVAGLGWELPAGPAADLVLTVFWVVGIVNGFNLMDNLDGACGTVAAISALGIGTLAALHGNVVCAGMAFALAGACAGFLRFNLVRPARIFLGDGGSMPIGFLIAALGMATSRSLHVGNSAVFATALLTGVVMLDTTLVTVSRRRRGVSFLTGGRDHLTHRLLLHMRSPRWVAVTLAILQGMLCALAIVAVHLGFVALVGLAMAAVVVGPLAILLLDGERWRPAGIAAKRTFAEHQLIHTPAAGGRVLIPAESPILPTANDPHRSDVAPL